MKPTITRTMLVPRYVAHFQCLGPTCPSTCCNGWRVTIDKSTYQLYKETTDRVLQPLVKQALKRNRHAQSVQEYGQIRLGVKGCPLQDGDGLCQVQRRLGEGALSDTCQSYPRTTRRLAGHFEQAMTLSCPESARLALLSEDAFTFEAMPLAVREHQIADGDVAGIEGADVFATRAWVMQLLHTEALPIGDRLAILGLLCDRLEALLKHGEAARIGGFLQQMTALVESGSILTAMDALPRDERMQIQLFAQFLCDGSIRTGGSKAGDVLAQAVQGLGADEQGAVATDVLLERYRQGCTLLVRSPDFNAVLSRYFLNQSLLENFPWRDDSPLRHHRRWVVSFGVLRVLLAGWARKAGRPPGGQEMANVIWAYSRIYQHSRTFAESIEATLERCAWSSLPRLLAVLR